MEHEDGCSIILSMRPSVDPFWNSWKHSISVFTHTCKETTENNVFPAFVPPTCACRLLRSKKGEMVTKKSLDSCCERKLFMIFAHWPVDHKNWSWENRDMLGEGFFSFFFSRKSRGRMAPSLHKWTGMKTWQTDVDRSSCGLKPRCNASLSDGVLKT